MAFFSFVTRKRGKTEFGFVRRATFPYAGTLQNWLKLIQMGSKVYEIRILFEVNFTSEEFA